MLFGRSEFIPEGAGVSPDTPRKKGLARLVEIMSRDLDGIFLSGSLALLACVPAAASSTCRREMHPLTERPPGGARQSFC